MTDRQKAGIKKVAEEKLRVGRAPEEVIRRVLDAFDTEGYGKALLVYQDAVRKHTSFFHLLKGAETC